MNLIFTHFAVQCALQLQFKLLHSKKFLNHYIVDHYKDFIFIINLSIIIFKLVLNLYVCVTLDIAFHNFIGAGLVLMEAQALRSGSGVITN